MDMFSLKGKVAVISGGSGLYGRQMVKALAIAGARVYVASRNMEKNNIFADELNKQGYDVEAAYLDTYGKTLTDALTELKAEGLAQSVGISFSDKSKLMELTNPEIFDSVQIQ